MPTTLTKRQEHWDEIVRDPSLKDLPYKVETNEHGQIILSPHKNVYSDLQLEVAVLLRTLKPEGKASVEFAIATKKGVKSADAVWRSRERDRKMKETGDPTTLAPEVCVEVLSPANTEAEMDAKRELYRNAGAEEVWVVDGNGQIRFFRDEELNASKLIPEFPTSIEV